MINKVKKCICTLVCSVIACLASAATYNGVTYDTSGCRPGVWTSDFSAAKAYADKNNIPLLMFWGSTGCGYCSRMINRGLNVAPFTTWMAANKIVYIFMDLSDSQARVSTDAKKFVMNSSGNWPYMRIYWKKTDGTTVNVGFTGRKGQIPNGGSGSESEQLVNALKYYVGTWNNVTPTPTPTPTVSSYAGGDFMVPGTSKARLEMIKGETQSVVVPLTRTNTTDVVATNVLVVGDMAQTIVWNKGETTKYVTVDVANSSSSDLKMTLKYTNAVHSTSTIYAVSEPANSTKNPLWYDQDPDFGEWTVDLEAALGVGMDGKGTLVFLTGALWCPWCLGLENYVLDSSEFKAWAKENELALALIDNTKRSANDSVSASPYSVSTVANGAAPSLLSYAVGANGLSGAAYLSRHGVSQREAAAMLQENHELGYLGGELCAPEALRTGYPTLILLDPDGNERGRFTPQYTSTSTKDSNGAYPCNKTENLARLKEFLKLLDNDIVDEDDKYATTTSLTHALVGTNAVSLSVCENAVVYKLNGFNGKKVTFTKLADTAGKGVTLEVLKAETISVAKKNSSGATASTVSVTRGASVTSSDSGKLAYVFPSSGTYYLKVSSYDDAWTTAYGTSGTTTKVTFKSELTPDPTENKYVSQKISATLPVYSSSGTAVAGSMAVSATKKGRVTVKYTRAGTTRAITMRGKWGTVDFYGVSTAKVSSSGVTAQLSLNADGVLSANLTDGSTALVTVPSVIKSTYADYYGYYTVALPVEGVSGKTSYPTGTGYMIVKANTAVAKRKGRVYCKVFLPDGKNLTSTAYLSIDEDGWGRLSVMKKSGKNSVLIALKIRPKASKAPTCRAVIAVDGVTSKWSHSQTGVSYTFKLGVYGSYYASSDSLVDCCGDEALSVGYDTANFASSSRYGALTSVLADGAGLIVGDSTITLEKPVAKFSVKVRKSTGLVTGRTRVTFANKTISVPYKAVIIPDWTDCGCYETDNTVPLSVSLPAVCGTCYYSDRINGKTAKRGFAIGFEVDE